MLASQPLFHCGRLAIQIKTTPTVTAIGTFWPLDAPRLPTVRLPPYRCDCRRQPTNGYERAHKKPADQAGLMDNLQIAANVSERVDGAQERTRTSTVLPAST